MQEWFGYIQKTQGNKHQEWKSMTKEVGNQDLTDPFLYHTLSALKQSKLKLSKFLVNPSETASGSMT